MKKVKIFVVIFGILLIGISYWYYQKNIYSKEVLKLEILGPSETLLLEEVEYRVKYKNNGNFNLEDAKLIFECPKNSLECFALDKEETEAEKKSLRKEFPLETIYPGQERAFKIKARLLGKEGEIKEARAWLSYRPKGLRAFYEASTTFGTQIKRVLINFEFDLPSKAESGRELKFSLNYFSNLPFPLSDLGIKIDYPSNFQFLESRPRALEKTDFEIKSLNPTQGGRIEIRGEISGKTGEQKIFKALLGVWQEGEFVVLKETVRGVEMIEPLLYLSQLVNGRPDYTANLGEWLHYEIYFRNLGKTPFERLSLMVELKGELFDLETIKSDVGERVSKSNTIIWDWKKIPELKFLESGQEGKIEFWVKLKDEEEITEGENLRVSNEINFLGETRKEFFTKINSKLTLIQKGYIGDEIFNSPGPLPPKVKEKSYFTIFWEAKNFYNRVTNAKIKATLSPEVELTGKVFPETATFTFDSASREIIWQIGEIKPCQEKVRFAFQIALTLKEEEKEPTLLISQAEILGEDTWTNQTLSATTSPLYTSLTEAIIGEGIIPFSPSNGRDE